MSEKRFNGKAVYNPSGKAGEYSYWACNFYVGCSNMCEYCYCKKGILSHAMGQNKAQLKMCFKDETDALAVFKKELIQNKKQIQEHGLFFSFTTDPMLEETHKLHWEAIHFAMVNYIPVKILTKCVGRWVDQLCTEIHPSWRKYLAIGFTLTGHDELEGKSAPNMERIRALADLHKAGYKTFASIEPVVDFVSAYSMISLSHGACDLYKIGLMSGKRYNAQERSDAECFFEMLKGDTGQKFYLKDTLITLLKQDRDKLPEHFVRRDYNLFDYNIGDIVPYRNTKGNVKQARITSFEKVDNGKTWFHGVDTVTGAKVWYPVHISQTLGTPNCDCLNPFCPICGKEVYE